MSDDLGGSLIVIIVLFLCGILGYIGIWGVTVLLQRRSTRGQQRHCPACLVLNPEPCSPAGVCLSCGELLAPWLFADRLEIFNETRRDEGEENLREDTWTNRRFRYVVEHRKRS